MYNASLRTIITLVGSGETLKIIPSDSYELVLPFSCEILSERLKQKSESKKLSHILTPSLLPLIGDVSEKEFKIQKKSTVPQADPLIFEGRLYPENESCRILISVRLHPSDIIFLSFIAVLTVIGLTAAPIIYLATGASHWHSAVLITPILIVSTLYSLIRVKYWFCFRATKRLLTKVLLDSD